MTAKDNNPTLAVGSKKLTRCASLLAYVMLKIEVPSVVRLAAKCAKVFFKFVDLQEISMYKPDQASDAMGKVLLLQPQSSENIATVVKSEPVDFLEEAFKVIGAKISGAEEQSN